MTKIGGSVWLSLFICNTVVCEAAYASLAPALAVLDFQNNYDGLNDSKGNYNLHYDDVRGNFLWPPHGTTPTTAD